MIWVILAVLGVPLWLCALALVTIVLRNRGLRKRAGDLSVRMHPAGARRWTRGHGFWVHDVFSFRASPAGWKQSLLWVVDASARAAAADEREHLHRLGEDPIVVRLTLEGGTTVDVAAASHDEPALLGPFAAGPVPSPASAAATARSG